MSRKNLVAISVVILFSLVFLTGCVRVVRDPQPITEITYGEFPIRIVYELHGEEHIFEDVLIIEFAEVLHFRGFEGSVDTWHSHLKNHPDMLDQTTSTNQVVLFQTDKFVIRLQIPNENFYMGTETNLEFVQWNETLISDPRPRVRYFERADELRVWEERGAMPPDVYREYLYEVHGFRLISFESAPPIENVFR